MKNKLFQWVEGQHKTGYFIYTIARVANRILPFDAYIIKYPEGSSIPPHKDKTKNGKHYRINIIVTHPPGGEFQCENVIYRSRWLNFFRPDIEEHSVTKVEKGTRYVFSIGWLWYW